MNKAAIVINPDLPTGLLANAVACITSGLFVEGKDYVGAQIEGKNVKYFPITKIPILILKPGQKTLLELCQLAKDTDLKYIAFTKEAQTTTNYEEYTSRVNGLGLDEVTIVGLGIVGEQEKVNSITGNLPMLR